MAYKDDDVLDLNALLHPAQAFEHPRDVVNDPDLTLNEKRSILASWASDACAVDSAPALRKVGEKVIKFDDVIDALRELDKQAQALPLPAGRYRKALQREALFRRLRRSRGSGSQQGGTPLQ